MGSMADHLSTTLAALADPTRRAILARLALGETSVTELAAPFGMSLPAVSKHLNVLERAGLIARGRDAQWRPCRLQPAPLKEVADWIEHYRRFWEPEPRPARGAGGQGEAEEGGPQEVAHVLATRALEVERVQSYEPFALAPTSS